LRAWPAHGREPTHEQPSPGPPAWCPARRRCACPPCSASTRRPSAAAEQAVDLLNDRWLLSLTLSARAGFDKGAQIEAFLAALRGQTNYRGAVALSPGPSVRGTLASATAASAAQGASAVVLTGSGTLKAGDMLGISGLLLQVAADVTVGTSTSVSIVNRLRSAVSGTVTLTRPTANFRLTGSPAVSYVPGMSEPVSLDFAEVVA
jgi:hypothetical protein